MSFLCCCKKNDSAEIQSAKTDERSKKTDQSAEAAVAMESSDPVAKGDDDAGVPDNDNHDNGGFEDKAAGAPSDDVDTGESGGGDL